MSATLTNGLKLPDKGSVDWYADMQSNYAILDGAVGTVAEHTTQIAGKAPAVHTHTKADITDFPAYGNTAGTICEGNDSRLSDARTPVSHTHVTADVTDLLNSAHTWTRQNTFSDHTYIYGQWKGLYFQNPEVTAGVAPSGDKRNYISFIDSNGYNLGSIILNVTGANSTWFQTGVFAKDSNDSSQSIYCGTQYRVYGNGEKYFNPSTNGDIYLGTSTLQWKSVYAQSYYYNGTAWGLDKANVWTGSNKFIENIVRKSTSYEIGNTPASNVSLAINFQDKNNTSIGWIHSYVGTSGATETEIIASNKFKNNALDPTGTQTYQSIKVGIDNTGNVYHQLAGKLKQSELPFTTDTYDLGSSSFRWKTLNGVNPGALSIFNPSASYDPIDIPTSWDTSGTSWNALSISNLGDGWVCITYYNCSEGNYILVRFGGTNGSGYPSLRFEAVKGSDNKYYIYALFPVAKAFSNIYFKMIINSNANLTLHHYIPAYGTV